MVTGRLPTALMTYNWRRVIEDGSRLHLLFLALLHRQPLILFKPSVVHVCAARLLFGAAFVWEVNSSLRILLLG